MNQPLKQQDIDTWLLKYYEDSVDAYEAFLGINTDAESDMTAPDRLIKEAKLQLQVLIDEILENINIGAYPSPEWSKDAKQSIKSLLLKAKREEAIKTWSHFKDGVHVKENTLMVDSYWLAPILKGFEDRISELNKLIEGSKE